MSLRRVSRVPVSRRVGLQRTHFTLLATSRRTPLLQHTTRTFSSICAQLFSPRRLSSRKALPAFNVNELASSERSKQIRKLRLHFARVQFFASFFLSFLVVFRCLFAGRGDAKAGRCLLCSCARKSEQSQASKLRTAQFGEKCAQFACNASRSSIQKSISLQLSLLRCKRKQKQKACELLLRANDARATIKLARTFKLRSKSIPNRQNCNCKLLCSFGVLCCVLLLASVCCFARNK